MHRATAERTTPSRRVRRVALGAWLLLGSLLVPGLAHGQENDSDAAIRVKAAYLYKFPKFVRWPRDASGDPDAPLVIGVLGDDPFGPTLDATVAGETVRGRRIEIRRLGKDGDARAGCHVVFVSGSEEPALETILASLRGASVLTVSDIEGFAARGGMIELAPDERGRIIFKINRRAAERARLRLSARLLRLAKIVETDKQPAGRSAP